MLKFNFEISLPKVEPIKWWQLMVTIIVFIGIVFGYISYDDLLEFIKSKFNTPP